MNPAPRISIIIPSYNQGRFLAQALDSIFQQSLPPYEVLVMDGASQDETRAVLERYAERHPQLHWRSEPDAGPADAVNKGLARAQGDWIGICSADDCYCPGAFAAVAATAASEPEVGFIYGDLQAMTLEGRPYSTPSRYPPFSWEALFGIALCIHQGSIFFKASVARAAGGWNPAYYGCDLDYWLRLMFRTRAVKLSQLLSYWRTYPEQRTRSDRYARICRDYQRMIEESADLRAAPPRLRRLARASCSIMALSYPPTEDLWILRRHFFKALFGHPTFWRYQPRARLLRLLPGYAWLRGLYRRLVPAREVVA
jgi:glycosyltransferase involved in cell wall biosynthesis